VRRNTIITGLAKLQAGGLTGAVALCEAGAGEIVKCAEVELTPTHHQDKPAHTR
jgi:hypothetical protein